MSFWSSEKKVAGIELNDSIFRYVVLNQAATDFGIEDFGERSIPHGLFNHGQITDRNKLQAFLVEMKKTVGNIPVNISLPDFHYTGDYTKTCHALRLAFEGAGFTVNNLECESDSVNRVCDLPLASPYYGAVKIDDQHSSLVVKDGGQLKSSHKIDLGQNLILKNIERTTGLDKTEAADLARAKGLVGGLEDHHITGGSAVVLSALADEINKIMATHAPYKVYVYGDTGHWPGVSDYLNSRINTEVSVWPIKEGIKNKISRIWPDGLFHRWLTSLGVALRYKRN